MAAVTIHNDFEAQENKICHCFHFFPLYLPWSDGTRCHVLCFLNAEFQASSLTSFTLIKRLFSSSSLSAINMVSSAYLRLLLFLLEILIPACDSYSLASCLMYRSDAATFLVPKRNLGSPADVSVMNWGKGLAQHHQEMGTEGRDTASSGKLDSGKPQGQRFSVLSRAPPCFL